MPRPARDDSRTMINHIRGGVGGSGGAGHTEGIGGQGGPGKGPTLNYIITAGRFTMNNNRYVGSPFYSTSDNYGYARTVFNPTTCEFALHGGAFTSNVTSNVYNPPQEEPSAFRKILLGDVNLKKEFKEMRLDIRSGVVGRQSRGKGVRQMYRAELRRDPGPVTVAIYQGHGAKEEWRKHLAKYESIRHPNIMQLYGLVHTKGLCAMVFHDDLIPLKQFLDRYKHSSILTTYILGYCGTEWGHVWDYLPWIFHWESWIRPVTGGLCVDLVQASDNASSRDLPEWWITGIVIPRLENISLDNPDAETAIISNLPEDEYHQLCESLTMPDLREFSTSTHVPIRLGPTIFYPDSQHGTLLAIADPLRPESSTLDTWQSLFVQQDDGHILANSWIRYDSRRVCGGHFRLSHSSDGSRRFWLAQAGYISAQVAETSDVQDYVWVDSIVFALGCLGNRYNTGLDVPKGYLFLCPPEDFQTGPDSIQWPECPAYWSFDPSGSVRLGTEAATILGFPIIHIETRLQGWSWDSSVYEGLRRFQKGKRFNPDSQEAAIHLDYPLYQLSNGVGAPLLYHDEYWRGKCYRDDDDGAICRRLGHYFCFSMLNHRYAQFKFTGRSTELVAEMSVCSAFSCNLAPEFNAHYKNPHFPE